MLQVWWTHPGMDGRRAVTDRLLAEERPLYLPAGLPLLRQTVRDLAAGGQREEARVFAGFLERTFAAHCRDWCAISAMEQRVLLGHLLRTLDLPELGAIREKPGLIRGAQRLLRELKEAGIPRADWPSALAHGKGPAFARLAEAYQQHLESRHLADREDVYRLAAVALAQTGLERQPSLVVLEGFATLNALERSAIEGLAAHLPVLLVVTYDPDRPALFAPTVQSLGAWWQGAAPTEAASAARPAAIAALQDRIFAATPSPCPGGAVHFTEAPDPAREIAQVARTIKQMLLAKRCRPDEIAIVSNRPEQHRELLRRTMERYGIPISLPPEALITAPVVQALLGLLRGDADALKSPYLAALQPPLPDLSEGAAALTRLLPTLDVEGRILALMHGGGGGSLDAEAAALGARELLAYRGFLRVLVRLEQAHGQTELPFLPLLTEELAAATYPTQRRSPGPAVRFLVPAQAEGLQIPVVFVVGLSEGEFPTARAEDWILPDRLRRADGRLMTRDLHRQVERLQFLRALRAAISQLYLSRSTASADGSALIGSSFWEEAMACLGRTEPDLKLSGSEVTPAHLDRVHAADELLQRLMQILRHGSDDPQETALALELLERGVPGTEPTLESRVAAEDGRRSPAYTPWDGRITDPGVAAGLATRLDGGNRRFSASELETYAACPFRYLGERVLAIREAEELEPDLDVREVGSALHRILAAFYRIPGLDLLAPEAEQQLAALVRTETGGMLAGLGPALQEAWRRQFHRQAMAWLAAERETRRLAQAAAVPAAEQLTPAYLEWSFGQKVRPGCDPASTTEPLVLTAGGKEYRVAGVVDRIDLDMQGGYTVYDYKSGKSPTASDIVGSRIRLQVPLYLLAARRLGLPGADRPLGGAYYGLRDRRRTGGIWRKSKKAVHQVSYHKCLLEDAEFDQTLLDLEQHVTTLLENLAGGDLTVNPRMTCPAYCPMRTACRFDEARLEAKAGRAGKDGGAR